MLTTEYMSGIENAYNAFKNSEDIEKGILASTRAAFGGSAYSVELLPDATYRVLWKNNIGNVYNSPGVILDIPILTVEARCSRLREDALIFQYTSH